MSLESSRVTTSKTELYRAILSDTAGEVFAINPNGRQLTALVETIDSLPESPTVRSLVEDSAAKWVRDDFLVASAAADEIAADSLSLRTTDSCFENTLLVTEETLVAIVSADDHIAGLVTDDEDFVTEAREKWDEEWNEAAEFSLRTPPQSEIHESLAEEFSEEVDADFRTMLETLDTTRDNEPLNEVGLSLLAAAKHGIQLFEISKWGEDTSVASKATFSRTKTQLEDTGLITTEKVPIDVGRPRLRLHLGDELQGVKTDELVERAQNILTTVPA